MMRTIAPELLDHLPPHDPRAIHSRNDLRKINFLMGHIRFFYWHLRGAPGRCFDHLVELGSGDGHLALQLARWLPRCPGPIKITLVDRINAVSNSTQTDLRNLGWDSEIVIADVLDWLPQFAGSRKTLIFANLFLHHFPESQIQKIFELCTARCASFAACDPRRAGFALAGSHFLGLIGCNHTTRQDAVTSVRAGFLSNELSRLWPGTPGWELHEKEMGLFSHWFSARRVRS